MPRGSASVTDIMEDAFPRWAIPGLNIEFINTASWAPLPDLIPLCFERAEGHAVITSTTVVMAESFFVDGTPGRVHITDLGRVNTGFHGSVADAFPVEKITLSPLPQLTGFGP